MFKLYLLNHTQYEYIHMCRSNFSQERCPFMVPHTWEKSDDLEIVTEFVFREKVKNKKKFTLIDPNDDGDDEDDYECEEDEQAAAELKESYLSEKDSKPYPLSVGDIIGSVLQQSLFNRPRMANPEPPRATVVETHDDDAGDDVEKDNYSAHITLGDENPDGNTDGNTEE